jgi:hypothetical protein
MPDLAPCLFAHCPFPRPVPHDRLRQVHFALSEVLRLGEEPSVKYVDLCVSVAKLVGVVVQHVALDPTRPKTPKDSSHLRAFSLALIYAVEAFAALKIMGSYPTYWYHTKEFIGAAARLGVLVCARSGRAADLGRLLTTVVDATGEAKSR